MTPGSWSGSWLLWAILSAIFAALTAILAKVGVRHVDSDIATLLRTVMITAVLGAILTFSGKLQTFPKLDAATWFYLGLSALATGASWLCYFRALQLGEASRVAPIDKLSVVLVALIAALFLGEKLSLIGWAGVALIAGGAILVALG